MGTSSSKIAVASTVASTPKPDPSLRLGNDRVGRLIDPRSPSTDIDRTPIQFGGALSRPSAEVESECAVPSRDPRSPSVGVTRTPMKVTVGSIARRLGMLFLSEATDATSSSSPPRRTPALSNLNVEEDELLGTGELGSTEPLLTPQTDVPASPVQSPFVHLGEAQVEVEVEVEAEAEADFSLEEAEEAVESPLHKRLSMSLITCHEGVVPVQIFAEVHQDRPPSPTPPQAAAEPHTDGPDHSYALPSVASVPVTPDQLPAPTVEEVATVAEVAAATEDPESPEEKIEVVEVPAVHESPVPSAGPSPGLTDQQQPQQQEAQTGIRCPTFDTKSPSQLVFKPQWLGKGFGAVGGRPRAQGKGGRPGSSPSPLALRVGTKNAANENKGQPAKAKQRGKAMAEGRSPLHILKETNSPRDQLAQMKLKASTPDRQRLGQLDRRVLTVALDKENR